MKERDSKIPDFDIKPSSSLHKITDFMCVCVCVPLDNAKIYTEVLRKAAAH